MMKKIVIVLVLSVLTTGFSAQLSPAELNRISKKVNPPAQAARKELPDIFPIGFFFGDGCLLTNCGRALNDPLGERRAKTFHDLAKRYVNVVLPSNARYRQPEMDTAAKYGMYVIPSLNLLHGIGKENLTKADPGALQKIRDQWKIEIDCLGKHPALLAWHIYDEPMPWYCNSLLNIRDFIRAYDGKHPVIYTHQNLPLGSDKSEWQLLASEPVIYSDCYSINEAAGRDPWLYGDVAMSNFRRVNPNADYWPTIQSYTYHYRPTLGELRIMVYHTLARGAKGMFYFTTGQSVTGWDNPDKIRFYESPGNIWFGRDPMLDEIGRINEHLATAGPLLLPLRFTGKYPYTVLNQQTVTAHVPCGLRPYGVVKEPMIDIGAFYGGDYDILVIHNNDPNSSQSGEIVFPALAGKPELYNLRTLEKVRSKTGEKGEKVYLVRFAPGDGALFFRGNDKTFAVARNSVLKRRFKQEMLLLKLELETAEANAVDTARIRELIVEAGKDASGDIEQVGKLLNEARRRLLEAETANPTYTANRATLEAMRDIFTGIDDYLLPCADEWGDMNDETRAYIQNVLTLTREFTAFENRFRQGQADVSAGNELLRKVRLLNQNRPPY